MPFLISSKQKSVHDAIWGEAGKTFLASKSGKDLLTAVQKDDKNTEDPIIVEEKTIEETPVSGHDVESKLVSSISGEDLVSSIASSRKGELSKEAGSRSRIGSEELKSSAEVTDPNPEDISKFSMAKRLIHTLMNMLFLPGFTCFKKITPKDLHLKNLWASDDLISEKHDANRIEVLRALLICLSNDLYKKPEGFRHDSNPWVAIACEASRYLTLRKKETSSHVTPEIVLSVLLNTIVNFDPSSRIIIQSKALPYSWTLSTTDFTPGEILVDHCLQVLLVLLEYRTLSPDRRGTIRSEKSLTRGLKVTNHFILGIAKLEDPERLADIISGFSHLLRQSLKGLSVIPVPGAKNFEGYQELTLLLLKFTEINEKFLKLVCQSEEILSFMRVMIYYLYVCRIEAAKTGLLHACAIVILKLSCERDFCIALNQRYPGDLPIDIPKFDGTYADLLILICHKLMMSSEEILKSVFHVLLTILYNVSPYITNLSVSTSSKLVSLFELFSSKKFLLASPNNQVRPQARLCF